MRLALANQRRWNTRRTSTHKCQQTVKHFSDSEIRAELSQLAAMIESESSNRFENVLKTVVHACGPLVRSLRGALVRYSWLVDKVMRLHTPPQRFNVFCSTHAKRRMVSDESYGLGKLQSQNVTAYHCRDIFFLFNFDFAHVRAVFRFFSSHPKSSLRCCRC